MQKLKNKIVFCIFTILRLLHPELHVVPHSVVQVSELEGQDVLLETTVCNASHADSTLVQVEGQQRPSFPWRFQGHHELEGASSGVEEDNSPIRRMHPPLLVLLDRATQDFVWNLEVVQALVDAGTKYGRY